MQARGNGECGEDEGGEGEATEPGGEGGKRKRVRPADGLHFRSDFILEAGAELRRIGQRRRSGIAGLGKLDSGEQTFMQSGGGFFDEPGGIRVCAGGAEAAPSKSPSGEGCGGINRQRQPRTNGVR